MLHPAYTVNNATIDVSQKGRLNDKVNKKPPQVGPITRPIPEID